VGINLNFEISRMTKNIKKNYIFKDEYGIKKQSGIYIPGRIVINIWRLLRKEIPLRNYNINNSVFNILGIRFFNF
jgi:DNA polymerase elongation subunit (family B)